MIELATDGPGGDGGGRAGGRRDGSGLDRVRDSRHDGRTGRRALFDATDGEEPIDA